MVSIQDIRCHITVFQRENSKIKHTRKEYICPTNRRREKLKRKQNMEQRMWSKPSKSI
jgi:hypothetical protein